VDPAMKELNEEVGFIYYLIIARLYDIDPKLNKNERKLSIFGLSFGFKRGVNDCLLVRLTTS
jgi:hypothetical protein